MKSDGKQARVLICDRIAEVGIELLQQEAEVDVKIGLSPAELQSIVGDYDAVVVRSATKIGAEIIDRADRLKVIGRAGAGLDNIDVITAKERGIKVVNCPDANTRAVAEHTMALILGLARRLPRADLSMKEGRWEKSKLMGTGLVGKTLGIVGFGRIGREVAIRAHAFGMRVQVNQRRPTPELNLEAKVEAVDLEDLLKESDFVTLHLPAKPETERMIGLKQLALMKPTAYLINTARGSVVDEADLLEALDKGLIAGAALDVFAKEPAIDSALAQHERVLATPHIAASTEDAQQTAALMVARQILEVILEETETVEVPLSLRVVPTDQVVPHEQVDPRRVERLSERLKTEGILSSPPVVVQVEDHYVVLDGATRVTALQRLNYPHIIVQSVVPEEGLSLHTWFHAIRSYDPAKLVKVLGDIPEIDIIESSTRTVLDEMVEYGGLCYLHTVDGKIFLIVAAQGANHLQALNNLTSTYYNAAEFVTRTLSKNVSSLQGEFPDLTALVVFPEYTVDQVLQISRVGRVLPAGITRFIIPGRVLRLNADLAFLKSDETLARKNEWLREIVLKKLVGNEVRYYEEPVYLLDE
jgi:phosphoglycerate dehydrogenase-like enzyme